MSHASWAVSGSLTRSHPGRGKTDREISHSEQFGVDGACAAEVTGSKAGLGFEPGRPLPLWALAGCQVRRGRGRACLCAHVLRASGGAFPREGSVPMSALQVPFSGLACPPRIESHRRLWESEAFVPPVSSPGPCRSLQPQGHADRVSGPETEPQVEPSMTPS